MRLIDFSARHGAPVHEFRSTAVSNLELGQLVGQGRVHCLSFQPGGRIGEHRTSFEQLFLVVSGTGWIAGSDREAHRLLTGQGAYLERGEIHSKGSDEGMTAIMVQAADLLSKAPPLKESCT